MAHCDPVALALRKLHDAAIPAHHSLSLRQVVEVEESTHFDEG